MVPDGYTLGWKSGGTNLHFGGWRQKKHDMQTGAENQTEHQAKGAEPGTVQ